MAKPTIDLSQMLSRAMSAYRSGKLIEAEQLCRHLIKAKPDSFDALHLLAAIQSNLGTKELALASYDRALKVQPRSPEALANRALTLKELGRLEQALAAYDSALEVRPDFAKALSNRGNTLNELKRFEEALASYDRALKVQPNYANALCNRGVTLHELKRFEDALTSYNRALALQPNYPEALFNRGVTLFELERFEEALASYDCVLKLRSDHFQANFNRGLSLYALRRFEEALASYDRALKGRPDHVDVLFNRGNALLEMKRFEDALASYDRALMLRPNFAEALSNRGVTLHALERFEEALLSYEEALTVRSEFPAALSNRGATLNDLRRYEEALASYDRALGLRPDLLQALSNRGLTLHALRQFDKALADYARALQIRPDFPEAHWNAAVLRLLTGDFARGWVEYEWRWKNETLDARTRNFTQPLWLGQDDIAGKTVLLHAEQGFGDTIQFCRYAPLVVSRAGHVILEVQSPLRDLMSTLPGSMQLISQGDPLPDFDVHCPLLSLPLAFATRLETIPSDTPYLSAPERKTISWRDRLGKHEKLRVGLVWAGNPNKRLPDGNRVDRQRSVPFNRLTPLLEVSDCDFYSLQKGDDAISQLRTSALRGQVVDLTDDLHDFSDTAALVQNLDLIITVDTAVAHLSGALGKQFWLLNRYNTCWRWLLDRDDTPWYPTGRLFRQNRGDEWDDVIMRVRAALYELLECRHERQEIDRLVEAPQARAPHRAD